MFRKFRRRFIKRKKFPESWRKILEQQVDFYQLLPHDLKARFQQMLKIFLWEVRFVPIQGMQITEDVKIIIGACAIRLVLHLDIDRYNHIHEVLVYPFKYRHPDDHLTVLGEVHRWGSVILSWPSVLEGLRNRHDGHDTALHEFAHALDLQSGDFNGAPVLRSSDDYGPWARVMSRHFSRLENEARPETRLLDKYGAKNPAEFFAVATESFFEKPRQMRALAPDLYDQLKEFYGFDPQASLSRD